MLSLLANWLGVQLPRVGVSTAQFQPMATRGSPTIVGVGVTLPVGVSLRSS